MKHIIINSYPFMAHGEIVLLDNLLEELKPKTCLEWGAGASTLYFPKKHSCIEKWDAIEHDGTYFKLVNELKTTKTNLYFFNRKNYALFPIGAEQKYDFILVDGIKRVKCLEVASNCLNKGGVCVLHDSGRIRYEKGYKFFKHHEEMISGIGVNKNGGKDFRGLMRLWND